MDSGLDNLQLHIESLIFTSSKAMTIKDIKGTLDAYLEGSKIKEKEIVEALEALGTKYSDEKYPFQVTEIAGGFQFMTKGAFFPLISQFLKIESKKKLSRAALETLSIISYKQPITKSMMESIRGVNCDYAVQKLLEKELVEITGRAEGPGRPLLYGTSEKFMNHFGLKSLNELPKIKEFEMEENAVGVQADDQAVPQLPTEGDKEQQDLSEEQDQSKVAEEADDRTSEELTDTELIGEVNEAIEAESIEQSPDSIEELEQVEENQPLDDQPEDLPIPEGQEEKIIDEVIEGEPSMQEAISIDSPANAKDKDQSDDEPQDLARTEDQEE